MALNSLAARLFGAVPRRRLETLGLAATIAWAGTGLAFNINQQAQADAADALYDSFAPELDAVGYAAPGGIIAQAPGATSLTLRMFLGRPVYEATSHAGSALFDARTAERLSPLPEPWIEKIGAAYFTGDAAGGRPVRLSAASAEFSGPLPAWRIEYADARRTRLYVSAETGRLLARRDGRSSKIEIVRRLHFGATGAAPAYGALLALAAIGFWRRIRGPRASAPAPN